MYRYSVRLKKELDLHMGESRYSNSCISSTLQDILHALSSSINALQLVDHAHAWLDASLHEACLQVSPIKKPRNCSVENGMSFIHSYYLYSTEITDYGMISISVKAVISDLLRIMCI